MLSAWVGYLWCSSHKSMILNCGVFLFSVMLAVVFVAFISGVFCITAFRSYKIILRKRRHDLVTITNFPNLPNGTSQRAHLLNEQAGNEEDGEEEEEIP